MFLTIYHIMGSVIGAINPSCNHVIRSLITMQMRSKPELFSQNSMHVMRVLNRSLNIDNVVGSFQVLWVFYRIKYRKQNLSKLITHSYFRSSLVIEAFQVVFIVRLKIKRYAANNIGYRKNRCFNFRA